MSCLLTFGFVFIVVVVVVFIGWLNCRIIDGNSYHTIPMSDSAHRLWKEFAQSLDHGTLEFVTAVFFSTARNSLIHNATVCNKSNWIKCASMHKIKFASMHPTGKANLWVFTQPAMLENNWNSTKPKTDNGHENKWFCEYFKVFHTNLARKILRRRPLVQFEKVPM